MVARRKRSLSSSHNFVRVYWVVFFAMTILGRLRSSGVGSYPLSTIRKRVNVQPYSRRYITSQDVESTKIGSSNCKKIFDLVTPEGRCIGVQLQGETDGPLSHLSLSDQSHWIHECLHPGEVDYAINVASSTARLSFVLGRLALRNALEQSLPQSYSTGLSLDDAYVLLKDEYGRPCMPIGFLGSISHKDKTAAGLVCSGATYNKEGSPSSAIGVDLEYCNNKKGKIARRILTANEISSLGKLTCLDRDEEVLLRFSLKEALYKAMHPLICQYVGFQEAEVQPKDDGSAEITLDLKSGAHESFGHVHAHWCRIGEFFLTTAKIELTGESSEQCRI